MKAGAPVDGIGFQSHLNLASMPTRAEVSASIQRFGEMGLQVHITELDIKCPGCDPEKPNSASALNT